MFRGTKWFLSSRTVSWLLAATLMVGATDFAAARTGGTRGDAVTGKLTAPDMEDHANYFAERRKGISQADLQKADKLRRKTIESINALLESKKKSVRRFELLLRLGELYAERHDYLRDTEMATYEQSWDTWNKLEKGKRGAEPKLDVSGSTNELTKAANSFRRLITEFPKHPRTDAALYSLAKTLARLGKETAVDYYKQLVKSFPKSPLMPDTYLALGEYYFDKHQVLEAIEYYKKVMAYKDHRAYPFAVYKLGWAYYNAPAKNDADQKENYKKAVTAFKLVVKLSDKDKNKQKTGNFDLREEAIKDMVMVWAEGEDVASAWKYFKTIGEEDSFYKMLERLGNIYADQGKNAQAIAVFQRLLKDAPKRANNPAIHAKILELNDLTNNIPAVVAELGNMQKLYLGNAAWVAANKKDQAAVDEATRLVELNMHRWGAMYHQRGQKAKSEGYLKYAAQIYAMYLESFPSSPNAYDIRYYLAEIQYDAKQYESAAGHYLIVTKSNPTGKYMKPAALNMVAAMNQLMLSQQFPKLPPVGQVPQPLEIPRVKKKMVEVIDQYVALLPKEKDGDPMRFTAAQIYFDYGHYPEAITRFEKITKEIPETKQARAAAKVILGYYADKEDWNKLIAWSQSFSKNQKLLDQDLKKYVVDLMRGAMFKRALAYEKAQSYERAARSFLEYQKEFPDDTSADRALYNGMLNFYKVGRIENALSTGTLLLDKYPKSVMQGDVMANVASTYEAMAKFDEAAAMYKRLATTRPTDARAANALYNAAVLYKGLKKTAEAGAMLSLFIERYPDHQITPDAMMDLAQLHEKNGAYPQAISVYEQFAKKYAKNPELALVASAKAASLKIFNVNKDHGRKDLEAVRRALTAKDAPVAYEARTTVASTLFKLIDPAFAEFQALRITDGGQLERQVAQKQQKLVSLAAGYEQIIDLGSAEYSVASLYRLGEAHENFASALFAAPSPKGASQADVDKLKTELEKVAFPLKEEAYKFFETAYKRSREVETFTVWTRRTYQKMVELAPEKHPAVDELSADPTYLSHEIKMSKPVAELISE